LKPLAATRSSTGRRLGTEKPMWSAVVPLLLPLDACARMNTSTFGNRTISWLMVPILITVPPSVSAQNFLCASGLVALT
jgi:hypothetical protein